ncbi:MAG: DUF3703 domain-containing protein [Algicola sp.]|nr:DUF3703 domain-containing protein [Algicola sp.]
MNEKQKSGYDKYFASATNNIRNKHYPQAMTDLGCCHILSKNAYRSHLKIHLLMLWVGLKTFNFKEVRTQLIRSTVAFATLPFMAGTGVNGKPGDSNYGFYDKLEIPEHLKEYFR